MNLDEFSTYCMSKPGVTDDYPMKGEVALSRQPRILLRSTNPGGRLS